MDGKIPVRLIVWLYDRLGWLYPPAFRQKFAEEQRQVFVDALEDGEHPPGRLFLRELALLPGVLLRCHWTAFRTGGWRSLLQSLAALLLFTVPVFFAIAQISSTYSSSARLVILSRVVVLAGLGAILLAGGLAGFPRWALPYLGFVLPIIALQPVNELMSWIGMHLLPRRDYTMLPMLPRLSFAMMWQGVWLIPILLLVPVVLVLLRLTASLLGRERVLRLPKGWRRERRWSDLAFLLYGSIATLAIFSFDEYHYSEGYMIGAGVCLFFGAVGFLSARSQRRAVTGLLAGATAAYLVIAVGKWMIVPLQDWPVWWTDHSAEEERVFESLATIASLVWMWILLLIPFGWRSLIEDPVVPPPARQPV